LEWANFDLTISQKAVGTRVGERGSFSGNSLEGRFSGETIQFLAQNHDNLCIVICLQGISDSSNRVSPVSLSDSTLGWGRTRPSKPRWKAIWPGTRLELNESITVGQRAAIRFRGRRTLHRLSTEDSNAAQHQAALQVRLLAGLGGSEHVAKDAVRDRLCL
jgi:hypothetical protein